MNLNDTREKSGENVEVKIKKSKHQLMRPHSLVSLCFFFFLENVFLIRYIIKKLLSCILMSNYFVLFIKINLLICNVHISINIDRDLFRKYY